MRARFWYCMRACAHVCLNIEESWRTHSKLRKRNKKIPVEDRRVHPKPSYECVVPSELLETDKIVSFVYDFPEIENDFDFLLLVVSVYVLVDNHFRRVWILFTILKGFGCKKEQIIAVSRETRQSIVLQLWFL